MLLLLSIYLPLAKMFCIALDKANWSQPKIEKTMYLFKSVNIVYIYIYIYIFIDFLLKSENYHGGKLNKTHLVNYVLHHLQGKFSGTQVFIFTLKSSRDSIVLYWFGTVNFVLRWFKSCFNRIFVFFNLIQFISYWFYLQLPLQTNEATKIKIATLHPTFDFYHSLF